eukprot:g22792.t1
MLPHDLRESRKPRASPVFNVSQIKRLDAIRRWSQRVPLKESAAPTWTGERSASSQQGRSPGLNSSRRYGSEETLKTLNQRPSRSAQNARLPLRAVGRLDDVFL